MDNSPNYHQNLNQKMTLRLREIMKDLPSFTSSFFIAMENTSTILTRVNYAADLRIFFQFLVREIPSFIGRSVSEITKEDLGKITVDDLYMFLDYLNLYTAPDNDEKFIENHERGKARKVACLRSFFKHYYRKGALDKNICELLDTPKLHEKAIVRLEPDEVANLLDIVESGEQLTEKQKQYHKKNVKRDVAILTLFLTTGIRVSELVSINVDDIDFKNGCFKVTRKGGNQVMLYFDDETAQALSEYLDERKDRGNYELASPLFLSMQGKRMSVRSVELMVKKYARIASPLKKISPHKLRSTYGTMLYGETGDIYLVADVLGHKDVNTTRKHYAAMSEDNRKRASRAVKLRK
ncbi:tyrosine-type recombinase/integrase [Christensenella intestinihominis]|uniref:tyrosine-type recombinase/integrase n=1 Tax=Christensenella intestinihominis TaxID=1851429 RepID=UPI00082F4914|nr:tyrosine-type recombinase/integrase [Christensenella intestinihominis]